MPDAPFTWALAVYSGYLTEHEVAIISVQPLLETVAAVLLLDQLPL
jgi:hypothetical protein